MQSIYNHIVEDEGFVYGLTNIKNHDEYTLNHSVNVCLLATAFGRRLGLSRAELVDLGMAAFFHDLGKTETPARDPEQARPADRRRAGDHGAAPLPRRRKARPPQGVPAPARSGPSTSPWSTTSRRTSRGYPRYFKKEDVNLFSKIVKVVDVFDAITTRRVYRAKDFTRAEALSLMLEQSGTEFNPVILKAFVNMMGVFPIGTLVALTTGEIGIVHDLNPGPQAPPPPVGQDHHRRGRRTRSTARSSTSTEKDATTGRFLRTIADGPRPGQVRHRGRRLLPGRSSAVDPPVRSAMTPTRPSGSAANTWTSRSASTPPSPRLSWLRRERRPGRPPEACHVLVSSAPELLRSDIGDFWDTGQIDGDRSARASNTPAKLS